MAGQSISASTPPEIRPEELENQVFLWMTLPDLSRTVRTTVTWKPATGYSIRFAAPDGRLFVYWMVSVADR